MLRPGGFEITDRAMEICGFEKGARLLEIGCGEGETLAHLAQDYGFQMDAIDINLEHVRLAGERVPEATVRYGDGEFLEDFFSFTFDGVVMECVLSLIPKPDEALHEAWCVIKKGGKIFISDLFHKDPDPDIMEAVANRAAADAVRPHEYRDCEEEENGGEPEPPRMVEFLYDGKFFLEPLKKHLRQVGYRILACEDRSKDLDSYVAERAMNGEDITFGCNIRNTKNTGYFLLVAEKPGEDR